MSQESTTESIVWPETASVEDVVPLLQALIRNACVNDGTDTGGQEIRNVTTIREYLGELDGVNFELIEPLPGRANLIATRPGRNPEAPRFAFVGHTDVVPADAGGWERDPFGGELVDGVVWGRGAVDMLNLTASMAVAFKMFVQSADAEGDLVYAATADEEAGSRYGMAWLAEHRPELVLTDFALTESGGGIPVGSGDDLGFSITVGQKGGAARRVRVRGTSGHGSMPFGVVGGVRLGAEAALAIANHRTQPVIPSEPWWENLLIGLGFDEELRARLCDPEQIVDALSETGEIARVLHAFTHMTLSPNVLSSGNKVNVIPGEAVIDVDVRLLEGQTGADAERELREALAGIGGEVTIEGDRDSRALSAPGGDPLYLALCEATREAYPGATDLPIITAGGNDARHYLSRGLPCYGFGLMSPAMNIAEFRRRFHGDNERIDVASLHLTVQGYLRIAEIVLKSSAPAHHVPAAI